MAKRAIKLGWDALKNILIKSAPPSGPSLLNSDPNDYKFPVYSLNGTQQVTYLSINDMESMPKVYNTSLVRGDILSGNKIQKIVSPYVTTVYNDDKIDIPLDFSTAQLQFLQTQIILH